MKKNNELVRTPPSRRAATTTLNESSFGEAYNQYLGRGQSKIDFLASSSKKNEGLVTEINTLVSESRPVLKEAFDRSRANSFSFDLGPHRSLSFTETDLRLLDTLCGETEDRWDLPKTANSTKGRRYSFEDELLGAHEYVEDPRLNNSCVLDSVMKRTAAPIVLRRTNSMDLAPSCAEICDNSLIMASKR